VTPSPGIGPKVTGQRDTYGGAFRRFERRLLVVVTYFLVLLAIGTLGFRRIEGWPWFDALYMTVVTASSVGFAEIHPLSPPGRVFTIGLLGLSVVGLGLLWAMTTALLVELDLGQVFRRRRTMKKIEKLTGHYIVCGAGRMGSVIVQEMVREGVPLVVVDHSLERIEEVRSIHPDILAVEGDATRGATLETAGIQRAKGLAASLASDADNLLLCLTARQMNPDLVIAARVNDEEAIAKMRRGGADHIVSTNMTGGVRMATMLMKPAVVNFLDAATFAGEIPLRLEEATVPEDSRLVGKRLAEARIPQETGLIVLALRRAHAEGPAVFNPGPETRLEAGDTMIVLGRQEQVERLRRLAAR
jgi:voltage-gated potassium channel